jgi:hypothetical protein
VHLFHGLRGESSENGSFKSAGDLRWFSPKTFETTQRETFNHRKGPLLAGLSATKEREFSQNRNAWLGRQNSNFAMASWKSGVLNGRGIFRRAAR